MKMAVIPMNEKGAILGQSWQYKNPPFLTLPGNPPLEEVTLYDFKVNEIPEPEDIDNIPEDYGKELVEVMEKKVRAYTYYCDLDADADWDDSIFWDGNTHSESEKKACLDARNKGGDGSKENPWKNLTWALEQIKCLLENTCSECFRIICSGSAHYTLCLYEFYSLRDFSGYRRLILENAKLEMDKNIGENTLYGFYGISETCFIQACLNMNLNFYENSRNGKGYGFFNCNQCDYLNCMTEINSSGYFPFFSSFQCKNSKFYHCEAKLQTEAESASSTANAFYLCISGIFYDCMVSVNSNSEIEKPGFMSHIESYGFRYCSESIFYRCISEVKSSAVTAYASSFDGCYYSKLYRCDAIAEESGDYEEKRNSSALGFRSVSNSIFFSCNSEVKSTTDAYGFILSGYSFFYQCNASTYSNSDKTIASEAVSDCKESKLYFCSIEAKSISGTAAYATGVGYSSFSLFYHCTVNATAEASRDDKTELEGYYSQSYGFRECKNSIFQTCNVTASSSQKKYYRTDAFSYGYYSEEDQDSSEFNEFNYTVSSSASSLPDDNGNFDETERECGIYLDRECKEGYRCERRTQEGTESC